MKLKDTRDAADYFTKSASDITRQLALAALAVVWIFKIEQPGVGVSVPQGLYWPAALAIAVLALDLLHYVYGAVAWSRFHRLMEKEHDLNEDAQFDAPLWMNRPAYTLFYSKVGLVVLCYVLLLAYLFRSILH